jgi:hypothetical protein
MRPGLDAVPSPGGIDATGEKTTSRTGSYFFSIQKVKRLRFWHVGRHPSAAVLHTPDAAFEKLDFDVSGPSVFHALNQKRDQSERRIR